MPNGILANLQDHWQERVYLIIDEKSVVGLKELHWIDLRLRIVMSKPETEFGGLNVILFGDFYQLPPVASKPLYDGGQGYTNDPEIACGQLLYSQFDRTIVLDRIMRQDGDDEQGRLFRDTLAELRDYGPDSISDRALQLLLLCLCSDWPRGHSVHLCVFFLYMLCPINFTLHKLPTSEILAFLKCWFFPASFASICLDSGRS
jgi:PIF1-like helicase